MSQRLKTVYETEIVPKLMGKFKYKNKHQVPRIEKIVINRGLEKLPKIQKLLIFLYKR